MAYELSIAPGPVHKVIGLVSGGKDSCFNLLHCVGNGHQLVALATLTPDSGIDELDSHLYQSVGTSIPPYIAKAMGVPHYSRVIQGSAVAQGAEYGDRSRGGPQSGVQGDETEDLLLLLQDILSHHPEATAVSTGAILSTYQRLRIEHVCARLGLVSLGYLWQAEQLPLLESMQAAGMEVTLVKVAGVGLTEDMIGASLWQQLPHLRKLERMYGSHPAGEGGEYETITTDSPLFSHSIKLHGQVVISDPEPNLVAYLQITGVDLVKKSDWVRPGANRFISLIPSVLDSASLELLRTLGSIQIRSPGPSRSVAARLAIPGEAKLSRYGHWFSIVAEDASERSIGDATTTCFAQIQRSLEDQSLSLVHVAYVTFLLPSISLFPEANAAYSQFFGSSPPSRATVAVPLPEGVAVRIQLVGYDDRSSNGSRNGARTSLHVQSLSYWAPANIGPYSQAITVGERVHIAGQVPLVPSTLTIPRPPSDRSSPYPAQCALALQHVQRIIAALRNPQSTGGGWSGWLESVVAWWVDESAEGLYVVQRSWAVWAERNDCEETPLLIVRAKELPKNALVEFQTNLHTGRAGLINHADLGDDDDDDGDPPAPAYGRSGDSSVWWEACETAGRASGRKIVFINDLAHEGRVTGSKSAAARVYHLCDVFEDEVTRTVRNILGDDSHCMLIPVYGIHDRHGAEAKIAAELFW